MLRRTLARLLLAAALCAATAPAPAVTIPWTTEPRGQSVRVQIPLSLQSLADALASAGSSGFDGLRGGRPQAAHARLAALLQAALAKLPWLAPQGRENGLWTWRRNPTQGVAIYGPGLGGYNSFSWSRPPSAPSAAITTQVTPRWIPVALRPPAPPPGARGGVPAPVPLPPAAPLLLAGVALIALLQRTKRRRAGR